LPCGSISYRYCVEADPFVADDVVTAEIVGITPGAADERLTFLLP